LPRQSGVQIVTVNPNHPTGSFLSLPEATQLSALCDAHDLALISDEVFGDSLALIARDPFGLVPSMLPNEGGFPGPRALTLVLSGLSKVCGLPQVKVGWIAVSGDPALRADALARLEWLADAFLSVGQTPCAPHSAGRMPFQKAVAPRRTNRAG
jgi:aspartate/methionine/tyrosine aminotransferase